VSGQTADAKDTRSSRGENYMQNVACWADQLKLLVFDGSGMFEPAPPLLKTA
jgi:hypothetical protein